jgi:Protein kinase domain
MALARGDHLGVYEVRELIGTGAMGEVYRARDGRLSRDVALKILPDLVAADADRLARFKREAQVLASLNHTNIAAIYGFEEADGLHALVLEMVEGPTLADRIARGPIPVDESIQIARQIADALEVAHSQGVVHRDLKPANLTLAARKILDVPGVHEDHVEAARLEDLVDGDPIDAGGLHRHVRHAAGRQPVGEAMEVTGEGGKRPHGCRVAIGRHGDEVLGGSAVDPGGVGMQTFERCRRRARLWGRAAKARDADSFLRGILEASLCMGDVVVVRG